jgi:hypothetical protein
VLLGSGAQPARTQEERLFELVIQKRRIVGYVKEIRVKQGDKVSMSWKTDETAEIHLHGYDLERLLAPGKTTSMAFRARATGRFSIVSHGFGEKTRRGKGKGVCRPRGRS